MDALKKKYYDEVRQQLMQEFNYTSIMQVPRIEKIVLNQGMGSSKEDSKVIDKAASQLAIIALQKPVITKAKKSVSNFKLRQGMPIGLKVTLRGQLM